MENNKTVRINNEIHYKLSLYSDLIGVSRTKIVNKLLDDFLKNKIVANDYITPGNLFYFNIAELGKNKIVTASNLEPITQLENTYIIKTIPNNLDTFNINYNSYCYKDNKDIHRGILFYPKIETNSIITHSKLIKDVSYLILLFDYNNKENKLNLSLINIDDLNLYLDNKTSYIIDNFNNEKILYENILYDDTDNKIDLLFNYKSLCSFRKFKDFRKFKSLINSSDDDKKRLDNILDDINLTERALFNYDFTKAIFNNKYSIVNFLK